jgi:predicted secreted protein
MAATAGYVGTCKIAANTIQLVQTADLALARKILDTTALGGTGWDTSILGTAGAKLSLKGSLDQTDTNGQQAIITAFFAGTLLSNVILSPDGVKTYTMNCWVSDYKPASPATGKADFDFTLTVTGAVTAA